MSTVRLKRLHADYERLRDYVNRHPRLQLIQAEGTPPERYQLEYRIRSLRQTDDELAMAKSHMVEITLPLSYPRMPPQCRMLTPIFHPNIAPHAICIGDHWSPGEPLWSIVARIGEMIAYQSYNTKSPLNGEAARWVDQHIAELPLDPVSLMPDDAGEPAASPSAPAGGWSGPAAGAVAPSSLPTVVARRADPPPVADPPAFTPPPSVAPPGPPPVPVAVASESERRFACPHCGAIARWRPELAGKQLRCPRCKNVFRCPQ
jgi:ubiquitin-protein ligase